MAVRKTSSRCARSSFRAAVGSARCCTWHAPSAGAPSARCCASCSRRTSATSRCAYLNRLSDLLFVLSRWIGHHLGEQEYLWERPLEREAERERARKKPA